MSTNDSSNSKCLTQDAPICSQLLVVPEQESSIHWDWDSDHDEAGGEMGAPMWLEVTGDGEIRGYVTKCKNKSNPLKLYFRFWVRLLDSHGIQVCPKLQSGGETWMDLTVAALNYGVSKENCVGSRIDTCISSHWKQVANGEAKRVIIPL